MCYTVIVHYSSLHSEQVIVGWIKSRTPIMSVHLENGKECLQNFCMLLVSFARVPHGLVYCAVLLIPTAANGLYFQINIWSSLESELRTLKCSRVNIGRAWEGLHVDSRVPCPHTL